MEFKATAQAIIDDYRDSIMRNHKKDLEALITIALKDAYRQGAKDERQRRKAKS